MAGVSFEHGTGGGAAANKAFKQQLNKQQLLIPQRRLILHTHTLTKN